jgi:hypothetical protein
MSSMTIRRIHKYAGLFFAPTILFFALTGVLQTFDLHKVRPGNQPSELMLRAAALHKDQTPSIRKKSAGPAKAGPSSKSEDGPSPAQLMLKAFVAAASLSLVLTTLLGVILALQAVRGRALAWIVLGFGIIAPTLVILAM